MAEDYRVECSVKRPNHPGAHERIQAIGGFRGGVPWKHLREDAIKNIDSKKIRYYVQLPDGRRVNVIAPNATPRYLTTEHDGERQNNLLSLPDCPP